MMNDQPPPRRPHLEVETLRQALAEGEQADATRSPDEVEMGRQARLDRLRRAVAESEASGEATPFDMESWLEEQDRLDSAA